MNSIIRQLIVLVILFFLFGFITWLNGVLIAYLKIICEISLTQAFFVTTAFYASYFFMAIPVAFVIKQKGYKKSMIWGLKFILVGMISFIPAAFLRSFPIFLAGLFIQGIGLTLLQTAVNPYVTLLGNPERAVQRISLMGIANKLAGGVSGILFGSILLKYSEKEIIEIISSLNDVEKNTFLNSLAQEIIMPYTIMGIMLLFLIFLVYFSFHENIKSLEFKRLSFQNLPLQSWLGFFAIFFYVGAEVIVGDSIISFARQITLPYITINIGGWYLNLTEPSHFLAYVMLAMIGGYLISIWLTPKYLSQRQGLICYTIAAILFTLSAILSDESTSIWFIVLLGAAHAIMWPAIWPLTLQHAGSKIEETSAMLIMGILGGALLPPLFAYFSELITMHFAYAMLLFSYFYILAFGLFNKTKHDIRSI
ncbi:MAG: MFS transporter [Bacteroidales bacterium]|nr:MFS transporter [Bacteroidales bacterium]